MSGVRFLRPLCICWQFTSNLPISTRIGSIMSFYNTPKTRRIYDDDGGTKAK
ncbi:hypothetical protein PISMIDRAFT_670227 [Pisolithus microcarpus 441]|uniref:Uncharacterized protein n=1 Tax=Pisolithus microcarpus 441 TaxID=765257 RepID=A0A0C9Z114_9AGAM|nr:hypothetical protein PISMIDRAFT_670227 [Pisolithus microcarpus 441]